MKRGMFITFGLIAMLVGLGTSVSSSALLSMCGKGCWLNGLLYALFSDHLGKILFGATFYALGAWCIYQAVFNWRKPSREG
jgi:hypothetical protein